MHKFFVIFLKGEKGELVQVNTTQFKTKQEALDEIDSWQVKGKEYFIMECILYVTTILNVQEMKYEDLPF